MGRDHIEFVQAQYLPWRRIGPGLARPDVEYKLLSRDNESGGCTVLLRYPPGWQRLGAEHLDTDEEFYVLDGALEIDGRRYGQDCYGFLPRGWTRGQTAAPQGCVVLAFYDRDPACLPGPGDGSAEASARAVPFLDAANMAWDLSLNDSNLAHLGISRKNLRTDPETGERTFLSLILPHAFPEKRSGPQEIHPVVEEIYVIEGTTTGPQGTMYPGAYVWRPPGLPHGPFGSRWGSVSLIRFVGGRHVNVWTPEEAPFDPEAPYRPILPPDLAHLARMPWTPPPAY